MNQVTTIERESKPFNPEEDYYLVLGLERDCSLKEIKGAYKNLANKHHPDKGGDRKWFHLIKEAFTVLSDQQSRANYDEHGRFTSEEYQNAKDYIKSVVEQVVANIEDLEHVDMVETLLQTTVKNIQNGNNALQKQERIRKKFERNEHRSKNSAILEVFRKHKGIAITAIENIEISLRTFDVAMIMLKDYEYNFEVEPEQEVYYTAGEIRGWGTE